MPGGGVHAVGPGQITDDTELALCLAQGMHKGETKGTSLALRHFPNTFCRLSCRPGGFPAV